MAESGLLSLELLLPELIIVKENVTEDSESEIFTIIEEAYKLLQANQVTEVQNMMEFVIDKTWEDLNTGHWSLVPLFRRYIYSITSLLLAVAKVKQALTISETVKRRDKLNEALKVADHGLLLGGQLSKELTNLAEVLSTELSKYDSEKSNFVLTKTDNQLEFPGICGDVIPVLSCPSLEMFYSRHFVVRRPVKLKDCIDHWPAITKWKDINYLLSKAGERTVPVELGSKYDDSEWSQKLMKFREFVKDHVLVSNKNTAVGYLAQHQLFLQIPELKDDIREPEFCCCFDEQKGEGDANSEEIDINAWFGPAGTVSPLHFDPKHNLLAQIVGRKRVILYDPKCTDRLYPHESRLLHNTSQVDPEHPDYKNFPSYKDTPAFETILNPGEMLYIPPRWWHHIRALDVSFSVSFWW